MSLVGSLEDLGLGDILQIIHLSRKSGVLWIRSPAGEGQIIFGDGLIQAAFCKSGPSELRQVLADAGAVAKEDLDAAVEEARARGQTLGAVLVERGQLEAETLDGVRREHVSGAVLRMFAWTTGEFSFEIRDHGGADGEDLFLEPGMNPQFLALEGTRLRDEGGRDEPADGPEQDAGEAPPRLDEAFGPTAEPEVVLASEAWSEEPAEAVGVVAGEELVAAEAVEGELLDASDLAVVDAEELPDEDLPVRAAAELAGEPAPQEAGPARPEGTRPPEPPASAGPPPPVVVIDPELALLEWAKRALGSRYPRVHIFQRSEQGISRIRQYLARAENPLVLLGADAPADPISGARDAFEIVSRLKSQAPRMPLYVMAHADVGRDLDAGPADGVLVKPTPTQLADPRRAGDLQGLAAQLADELCERETRDASEGGGGSDRRALSPGTLARLRELSGRLRDPGSRGDVLSLVMRFAAETFSRVAMFMVRDDEALGMAQLGLPKAGGPDDVGLAEVMLPTREPAWFRTVMEGRSAVRAAPSDEGDQRLAVLLGNAIPREAYVAPIESGDRIVALLYGDNLPGDRPIGDTAALEVVLHEAGMALDRAVLERALEEAERA